MRLGPAGRRTTGGEMYPTIYAENVRMTYSAIKSSGWGRSEHSELSSSSSQQLTKLPTHDLVVQSTTVYRGQVQYLIRAYVQLIIPLCVYPFEIAEIVRIGKPQTKWRVPVGSVRLQPLSTADNFRACDNCIKNWAASFLGRLPIAPLVRDASISSQSGQGIC
jgi:hypothetical protein